MNIRSLLTIVALSVTPLVAAQANAKDIVHDAEYYVIEAQNGERWRADDKVIDQKLSEFRARKRQ